MARRIEFPRVEGNNQLVEGRHGYRYLYNKNDVYIGASLEAYGEFSGTEADFIESLLGEGDVVVEVGANIGALSVGIARKIGRGGHLYAFEAQRVVFQMLCANIALNGFTNVDCLWMAIGARPGTLLVPEFDFSKRDNFAGLSIVDQKVGRSVPTNVLDGFAGLARLNLIKIDVEGMETDVLEGGRNLIAKFRPLLYIENDRREKSPALITLIGGLGYELYWHLPPMFRKENHFRNQNNIFGKIVSQNMLCVPREMAATAPPLRRVTNALDWPA